MAFRRQRLGRSKPLLRSGEPQRAIQEKIGGELRQCLELPRDLTHLLFTILLQLNEVDMPAESYHCPHCDAHYRIVRIKNNSGQTYAPLRCKACHAPIPSTEGEDILKYFLVHRSRPARADHAHGASP